MRSGSPVRSTTNRASELAWCLRFDDYTWSISPRASRGSRRRGNARGGLRHVWASTRRPSHGWRCAATSSQWPWLSTSCASAPLPGTGRVLGQPLRVPVVQDVRRSNRRRRATAPVQRNLSAARLRGRSVGIDMNLATSHDRVGNARRPPSEGVLAIRGERTVRMPSPRARAP
jgi:hypothetical protein